MSTSAFILMRGKSRFVTTHSMHVFMAIKVGGYKLYLHQFCHFFQIYSAVGIVSSCFLGCRYKCQVVMHLCPIDKVYVLVESRHDLLCVLHKLYYISFHCSGGC